MKIVLVDASGEYVAGPFPGNYVFDAEAHTMTRPSGKSFSVTDEAVSSVEVDDTQAESAVKAVYLEEEALREFHRRIDIMAHEEAVTKYRTKVLQDMGLSHVPDPGKPDFGGGR